MTTPIGTPDWQRTQPGASKVLYANANVSTPVTVIPPVFCGGFSAIAVYAHLTGHRWFVHPHFYTDALQTIDLGAEEWIGEDGGTMQVNVPVRAPWVGFAIGSTDNVTNEIGTIALIGHNSGTDASVMRNPQSLISATSQAIGASAGAALFSNKTIDGPGIWTVTSSLASWSAILSGLNVSGATEVIARLQSGIGGPSLVVPLPNGGTRIDFVNNTAAAGSFNTHLYAGRG